MLKVDENTFLIEVTRGDTAYIVFSAKDDDGNTYTAQTDDILKFAVAKKVGADPLFEIVHKKTAGMTADEFWTIGIGADNEWYQKDSDGNLVYSDGKPVDLFKFADYVWDLQLTTSAGADTIIGKTDTISPIFRVWGEVSTE